MSWDILVLFIVVMVASYFIADAVVCIVRAIRIKREVDKYMEEQLALLKNYDYYNE